MKTLTKVEKVRNLPKGIPNRKNIRKKLREDIVEETNLKEKKKVEIGKYILEWHPKVGGNGAVMIYTKESFEKKEEFLKRSN